MIKREELIKIGIFNKPHGLKGELLFSFTDDIFDRCDSPYLVCQIDGIFVPFYIEEYRFRSDSTALMKLEDIDSDTEARIFTNSDVFYPKKYISDEDINMVSGDYFLEYLIIDDVLGEIGRIKRLDDSTVNLLFEVDYKNKEILIPANDNFISHIDDDKKIIYMQIPEALLYL